jgi:hypothetical protein
VTPSVGFDVLVLSVVGIVGQESPVVVFLEPAMQVNVFDKVVAMVVEVLGSDALHQE